MNRIQRRLLVDTSKIGITLTVFIVMLDLTTRAFEPLENWFYDWRARICQVYSPPPTDKLAHVDIDDPSLDAMGRWPGVLGQGAAEHAVFQDMAGHAGHAAGSWPSGRRVARISLGSMAGAAEGPGLQPHGFLKRGIAVRLAMKGLAPLLRDLDMARLAAMVQRRRGLRAVLRPRTGQRRQSQGMIWDHHQPSKQCTHP